MNATHREICLGAITGLPSSHHSHRILYIIGQLGLGGSERQLYCLLEQIDRSRFQTAVFVWDLRQSDPYVSRLKALGVPVAGFTSKIVRASKMKAFRQFVRRFRPEVVHSYSFHTNFAAFYATLFTGTVAVGSVRSDFVTELKNCGPLLGRLSARWPKYQIFNSLASVRNARVSTRFFSSLRPVVVRNGVDLHRFQVIPLPKDSRVCIAGVGSLIPLKRWDRVLRAAVALEQRGLCCLIRIAGIGPLKTSLEQKARELGIAESVKFVGHVDDIAVLVSQSAFLVHASDREGCPNAVIEAMACGRAVLATDAGDIPYLVDDGETGFVVRRGDDAALVERMVKLILDPDLCRSMGEAGRTKAEREFGLHRLVTDTLTAYRAAGWKENYNNPA